MDTYFPFTFNNISAEIFTFLTNFAFFCDTMIQNAFIKIFKC